WSSPPFESSSRPFPPPREMACSARARRSGRAAHVELEEAAGGDRGVCEARRHEPDPVEARLADVERAVAALRRLDRERAAADLQLRAGHDRAAEQVVALTGDREEAERGE